MSRKRLFSSDLPAPRPSLARNAKSAGDDKRRVAQAEEDELELLNYITVHKKPNEEALGMELGTPMWDVDGKYVLPGRDYAIPVSVKIQAEIVGEFRLHMGAARMASITCVVCSKKEIRAYASRLNLSVFERQFRENCTATKDVPEDIARKHSHHLLAGMLVDTLGIFADDCLASPYVTLCNECSSKLSNRGSKSKCPPCGLTNGTWVGDVPSPLQGLTFCEETLIGQYFMRGMVLTLRAAGGGGRQHGFKGNVISFPLNPKSTAAALTRLPHHPDALKDVVEVHYYGPDSLRGEFTKPGSSTRHILTVRREKVRLALVWLVANNVLYQDVQLDEANLAVLPDDGVPETCWLTMFRRTPQAFSSEIHVEREGYTAAPDADSEIPQVGAGDEDGEGPGEDHGITSSGVVDSNGTGKFHKFHRTCCVGTDIPYFASRSGGENCEPFCHAVYFASAGGSDAS